MDKSEVIKINAEIKEALKVIALKHKLDINLGNVTYSATEFNTKLTVKVTELNGKSLEQIEFEKYAPLFGFKPEDYRRMADQKSNGRAYLIVGFKPASPKFCLLAEDSVTGARYGLPEDARRLWGIKPPTYHLTETAPPRREEVL